FTFLHLFLSLFSYFSTCDMCGLIFVVVSALLLGVACQTPSETDVKGHVKWYQDSKGYGFLARDDGGADVFVHLSAIVCNVPDCYRTLDENEAVIFDVYLSSKGPQAANVRRSVLNEILDDLTRPVGNLISSTLGKR
ncbi:hypothetical protein PRIPAC_76453, partial [Pristionchus pacificus]|uniref:CSD domain-containing protein n=1 Tax=Pristionchus pacificus TaxID=54126 RepID=H3EKQ1_PRIPA